MAQLDVHSPYDGHFINSMPLHDAKHIEQVLETAAKCFANRHGWLKPYERMVILEKALQLMQERKTALATTAAEEGGKPLIDSLVEVERACQGVKIALAQMSQMTGHEIPMGITPSSAHRIAYTHREPVGVVCAISAFNHPFNLIVHQVIPAIATGCPVIVKPASSTPLSCFNLIDILYEAGLPKAWCQGVMCESALAEKMVTDPRVSFLSFIGSAKVGWHLRSKLAPGTHCALEHGGAAPVIVEADADMDDALPLLVKGGFYHAGQVCVSVQRIYVEHTITKKFAENLSNLAAQQIVGDPLDDATEVGPLITKGELQRVDEWVQEAVSKGATTLCGGSQLSETCYRPTVLLNPPADVRISQQEIFGPVVCIYPYDEREQAIKQANSLPLSFQGAVFTKNIDVAMDTVKHLNATAVMVNDHTAFRVDWMPFGGRKHSGLGMGGIPYSMHDMTYEKMMVVRSNAL